MRQDLEDDLQLLFAAGLERRLRPQSIKNLTFAWEPGVEDVS